MCDFVCTSKKNPNQAYEFMTIYKSSLRIEVLHIAKNTITQVCSKPNNSRQALHFLHTSHTEPTFPCSSTFQSQPFAFVTVGFCWWAASIILITSIIINIMKKRKGLGMRVGHPAHKSTSSPHGHPRLRLPSSLFFSQKYARSYLMCHLFLFAEVTLAHFLVGQGDQRQTWEPEQKCTQIGSDGMMVVKKAKNLKIGKFVVGHIG